MTHPCPGCGNEKVKTIAVIDGLKKYVCVCGMYYSTREIVVMQGKKDTTTMPTTKPGCKVDYPRSNNPAEIARAILRARRENKKD